MENIHKILNYSFTPLNLVHYIDQFISDRQKDMERLLTKSSYTDLVCQTPKELARTVLELYFEKPMIPVSPALGFNTYDLLGTVIWELSREDTISIEYNNILNVLQKRFEVNHRIFDSYNSNLHKNCDTFQSMQIYTMLAVVLSLRFLIQWNLNDFNTAIKLNDVVMKSGWLYEALYNHLIYISIYIEKRIIEEFNE